MYVWRLECIWLEAACYCTLGTGGAARDLGRCSPLHSHAKYTKPRHAIIVSPTLPLSNINLSSSGKCFLLDQILRDCYFLPQVGQLTCHCTGVLVSGHGSVDSSHHGSVNPSHHGSVNPSHHGSVNPSHNGSINPSHNEPFNLSPNGSVNPSHNRYVKPWHNDSVKSAPMDMSTLV